MTRTQTKRYLELDIDTEENYAVDYNNHRYSNDPFYRRMAARNLRLAKLVRYRIDIWQRLIDFGCFD